MDIDDVSLRFLRHVLETAHPPGWQTVEVIKNRLDDVLLPPRSVDKLFLIDIRVGMRLDGRPLGPDVLHGRAAFYRSVRERAQPDGVVHILEPTALPETGAFREEYIEEAMAANGLERRSSQPITLKDVPYHWIVYGVRSDAPAPASG
ncbi:MAG: hypothetical protein M5R36_26280 [Deltaproteobacteria bacterium]|nr:hypothetical protein [Deltaproteobacteria bacterium]